jgi:hypothetical protein
MPPSFPVYIHGSRANSKIVLTVVLGLEICENEDLKSAENTEIIEYVYFPLPEQYSALPGTVNVSPGIHGEYGLTKALFRY